MIKEELMTNA